MNKEFEIIKYKTDSVELYIRYDASNLTVWLSCEEIADLFGIDRTGIYRHILNIYKESALKKEATCAPFAQVQVEGNRKVTRHIKLYNLDVAVEIGNRIKSNKASLLQQFIDDYFSSKDAKMSDIIVYNNGNISLDVTVSPSEDTVWLSQDQIAELYETTRPNITIHIKKIFADGELNNSVGKFYLHTAMDGKTYQTTKYNLDMILAVGYRVKSKRAVEFRKWASNILKQYLLKGYAIDSNRIEVTRSIVNLENEVADIKKRVTTIEQDVFIKPIEQKIFFDGNYYDAREFLCSLVAKAVKSLMIIDPYFDIKGLSILKKVKSDVNISIVISKKAKLSKDDIESFVKQYGIINIYHNDLFHDRFIIIDETITYHIGTSLNYVGTKVFAIDLIDDKDVSKLLIKKATDY